MFVPCTYQEIQNIIVFSDASPMNSNNFFIYSISSIWEKWVLYYRDVDLKSRIVYFIKLFREINHRKLFIPKTLFSILGHKERIRKVFRTKKFFFDVKNLETPQIKQLAKDLVTLGGVSIIVLNFNLDSKKIPLEKICPPNKGILSRRWGRVFRFQIYMLACGFILE